MKKRIPFLPHILLALLITAIVGCGGSDKNVANQSTLTSSNISHLSDEEQLRLRIVERWNALIKLDMEKVYQFTTPTYRATYDLGHLVGQYGSQIIRKKIDINSIKIDDGGATAKSQVNLTFITEGFSGGDDIELTDRVNSTWVKRDGQWWYVEPR